MDDASVLFVLAWKVIDFQERDAGTAGALAICIRRLDKRTHITWIEGNNRGRPSHPTSQRKIHQILYHCRFPCIRRPKDHQPWSCLVFPLRFSAAIDVLRGLSAGPACADGPACEYTPTFECEMKVGEEGKGG
jgi:hypothetical protein